MVAILVIPGAVFTKAMKKFNTIYNNFKFGLFLTSDAYAWQTKTKVHKECYYINCDDVRASNSLAWFHGTNQGVRTDAEARFNSLNVFVFSHYSCICSDVCT